MNNADWHLHYYEPERRSDLIRQAAKGDIAHRASWYGIDQAPPPPDRAPSGPPAEFICEDDVRRAAREGRTLLVGPRTIVTPAARDAGATFGTLVWLDGTAR